MRLEESASIVALNLVLRNIYHNFVFSIDLYLVLSLEFLCAIATKYVDVPLVNHTRGRMVSPFVKSHLEELPSVLLDTVPLHSALGFDKVEVGLGVEISSATNNVH